MKMQTYVKKLFLVAALTIPATNAFSYSSKTCNGKIYQGIRTDVTFGLDRCSILPGTLREQDMIHGMSEWNNIVGMWDRFGWTDSPNPSCAAISNSDRKFTAFYATRATLGGSFGSSNRSTRPCVWPYSQGIDGKLRESDVAIMSDSAYGPPSDPRPFLFGDGSDDECLTREVRRRGTILHEFGHTLGLQHQNREMNLMNNSSTGFDNNHGRYCAGYTRKDAPHPDETEFAFNKHGSTTTNTFDVVANGYEIRNVSGVLRRQTTMRPHDMNISACPGDTIIVRASVGNRGRNTIPTNNTADYEIVYSWNSIISTYYPVMTTGTFYAAVGGFGTFSRSVTIPTTVTPGVWYIGMNVDQNNELAETNEINNSTVFSRRLSVPSTC